MGISSKLIVAAFIAALNAAIDVIVDGGTS